jgi:hypothetical protein
LATWGTQVLSTNTDFKCLVSMLVSSLTNFKCPDSFVLMVIVHGGNNDSDAFVVYMLLLVCRKDL